MDSTAHTEPPTRDLEAELRSLRLTDVLDMWGYTPTEEEEQFLKVLNEDREKLKRRLYAFLLSRDGVAGSITISFAQIGSANFFRLKKLWSDPKTRALKPIAGYASRPSRTGAVAPRLAGTRKSAQGVAARIQGAPNGVHVADLSLRDLSDRLREGISEEVNRLLLDKIARDERLRYRLDPKNLSDHYASEIAFDISAVSIFLTEEDPELLKLAVVMEVSTGLVLSALPCRGKDAASTQLKAFKHAAMFVQWHSVDFMPASGRTRIHGVAAPAPDDHGLPTFNKLKGLLAPEDLISSGERRYGSLIMDILGDRLGRLKFFPRSTRSDQPPSRTAQAMCKHVDSMAVAQEFVRQSVELHNREKLVKLSKGGLALHRRAGAGSMGDALDALTNSSSN